MTREQDVRIAELLGWTNVSDMRVNGDIRGHQSYQSGLSYERVVPHYTTDASADCLLRDFVRDNWTQDQHAKFANELWRLADYRYELAGDRYDQSYPFVSTSEAAIMATMALGYSPGDYSLAALAVVEEEAKT